MAGEENNIFVICSVRSIEPGHDKSISLSRITKAGEARPFPIVLIRTGDDAVVGYVNSCPHNGIWLTIRSARGLQTHDTLMGGSSCKPEGMDP